MFNFDSHKIIIDHFATKSEGVNSFFLQNFFQSQSVYTKIWGLKKTFVYSTYENKNRSNNRDR
jgi:hypothetical protein